MSKLSEGQKGESFWWEMLPRTLKVVSGKVAEPIVALLYSKFVGRCC